MVVENRAGAGGIVAADVVAKAAPDGYTLLVGADGPITILPALRKGLPYDVERELVPVASLGAWAAEGKSLTTVQSGER